DRVRRRKHGLRRDGPLREYEPEGDAWPPLAAALVRRHRTIDDTGGTGGRRVSRGRALVSASRGVGDILRITPLVRVCARLGYDVDLLIASDYPDVVRLLEPVRDARRGFHVPS